MFITGGAGYIGSSVIYELIKANKHGITVYDNFSTGNPRTLGRVGKTLGYELQVVQGDVLETQALARAIARSGASTVMHFAGSKSVQVSTVHPLGYYRNNVQGLISLLDAMKLVGVQNLVFSSSASVYGQPEYLPVDELHPLNPGSPYGRTKAMCEAVLRDVQDANPRMNIVILRYFNPVGAYPEVPMGDSQKNPSNLMPLVSAVAAGLEPLVKVYGRDYPTPDGSGVRDYLHIRDLALGHVHALEYLKQGKGLSVFNLGTGRGYSVLEVLEVFSRVSGRVIPRDYCPRRPGDTASVYGTPGKALRDLGWSASAGLEAMCEDQWKYQLLSQK